MHDSNLTHLDKAFALDERKRKHKSGIPVVSNFIVPLHSGGRILQKFTDVCFVCATGVVTGGNSQCVECRKHVWKRRRQFVASTGTVHRAGTFWTIKTLAPETMKLKSWVMYEMVVSLIVKTIGYNSTILKFNLPSSTLKICHSIQIALATECWRQYSDCTICIQNWIN